MSATDAHHSFSKEDVSMPFITGYANKGNNVMKVVSKTLSTTNARINGNNTLKCLPVKGLN